MGHKAPSNKKNKPFITKNGKAWIILVGGFLLLLLSIIASISMGEGKTSVATIVNSFFHYNEDNIVHQYIKEIRLPRALAGVFVGIFLAISGAIMQGMTRNPLADPSIMGVMGGSELAIAVVFAFFHGSSYIFLLFASFIGAGISAMIVFSIGSWTKGGLTPVKLALAGTAIGTMFSALSTTIAIRFNVARDLSFWYAGGVVGTKWSSIPFILVVAIIGILIALFISKKINVLSMGEDVALGLGINVFWTKLLGSLAVVLLTGASVSIAGMIGFIGLIIPHITRFIVGSNYRLIIPCSGILGGLLLILSDMLSRVINPPYETPVGAITSLIGVPFFLYLARREGRGL
ncbi:FecCD family ABC transporter permease [Heyndrickxia sp. FSL W8-0423]|uniref:FecCD family ABC transporter permease n=1 Tax=Heyndrickxia sp. FSL W8-0423 TaxID=2921601 RepID=UPI0030F5DF03